MQFSRYLNESPIFQVHRTEQLIRQRLAPKLSAIDVNFVQAFMLLSLLFDKKNEVGPSALVGALGLSKATVSHHLSNLEEKHLIQRKLASLDARVIKLQLTEQGKLKANQLVKIFSELDTFFETSLDHQKLANLLQGLYTMSEVISTP